MEVTSPIFAKVISPVLVEVVSPVLVEVGSPVLVEVALEVNVSSATSVVCGILVVKKISQFLSDVVPHFVAEGVSFFFIVTLFLVGVTHLGRGEVAALVLVEALFIVAMYWSIIPLDLQTFRDGSLTRVLEEGASVGPLTRVLEGDASIGLLIRVLEGDTSD